jgi:hypothetical protein
MSITRSKTLLELATQSNSGGTNIPVRQQLQVYSISEVDAAIAGVDLSPLESQIASISGDVVLLESNVQDISGDLMTLDTTVVEISGNLTIDINNLDISLTQAIFEHIEVDGTSPSISGSMYAWGKITAISGGPFWVALYK